MNDYKIKKLLLVVLVLLPSLNSDAQSFSALNSYLQKVRIGLVDEFFERFNGKTAHPDVPITNDESRINNLLMLYDLSQFTSKDDPRFNEAREMMNVMIKDSIQINFSDSTWAALAHCKGTIEGKSVNFDLYLTVQHRTQRMYKWVIAKADGNLFAIPSKTTNDKVMLSPNDHETNFMSLRRMSKEQPYNIKAFMAKGFEYDPTSVFAYLLYTGKLKIDYVDDLEFVFTQVPGYIFNIRYFEREKNNAGWLISQFYESTQENKDAFLTWLHSQKIVSTLSLDTPVNTDESLSPDVNTTSETKKDFKEMYMRRMSEKFGQLEDYLHFMQGDDTIRSKSMYETKMVALFAEGSKVHLTYAKKSKNQIIDVAEFGKMLTNKEIQVVRIDSISVPIWDEKINSLPIETNRVELPSVMRHFSKSSSWDADISTNGKLYAYKEDTEDGIEWLPIFGNLVVKVEKRKK